MLGAIKNMKSISYIFLTFFLIQSTIAQVNWTTLSLNGKPQWLSQTEYFVINGVISDSIIKTSVYNFNSIGNAERIQTYKENEDRLSKIYFNHNGIDTLWLVYQNDTLNHKWKKKIKNQKIIKKLLLDYNDSTEMETRYFYDSSGFNFRKETNYRSGFTMKVIKTHDSSGVLIQELWYNKNDSLTDSWIILYNKAGNETHNIGTDFTENKFYHDIRYFNKQKDWTKFEEVDIFGNVISSSEWLYIYDEKNNWIEKKEFKNGKIVNYQKREIIYQ